MAAVYPNQYKSFATHRNLVEDVDASHVNNLQDEVAAIQHTLGITPQKTVVGLRTKSWASVGARLDAIQRGEGMPAVCLATGAVTFTPPPKSTDEKTYYRYIAFPKPAARLDPEGLHNGSSITVNRAGLWIVTAQVRGSEAITKNPERYVGITVNRSRVAANDFVPNDDGLTHLTIVWCGLAAAGAKIELIVRNPYNGGKYKVDDLKLTAAMLREL